MVFDQVQPGHALWPESVDIDALPDVSGWLRQVDRVFPFLLVQVDRTGGDLALYRAVTQDPVDEKTVKGETFQIRKVPVGGWAHSKYQHRAEGIWAQNAAEVAEALTSVVGQQRPRAVLVAGDVRAVQELIDAVGTLSAPIVKLESGGRAAGTSEEALWAEVEAVVAQFEAHAEREVAERLAEGVGRQRGVAVGPHEVLEALVKGQVDTLVVDLDEVRDATIRPRDFPGLDLPGPVVETDELPADRVLVAAAARSDAEISLLPSELIPQSAVAAILRWED